MRSIKAVSNLQVKTALNFGAGQPVPPLNNSGVCHHMLEIHQSSQQSTSKDDIKLCYWSGRSTSSQQWSMSPHAEDPSEPKSQDA
jgi:hypothetical protein